MNSMIFPLIAPLLFNDWDTLHAEYIIFDLLPSTVLEAIIRDLCTGLALLPH